MRMGKLMQPESLNYSKSTGAFILYGIIKLLNTEKCSKNKISGI